MAIPPRNSTSPSLPSPQADHVDLAFIVTPGERIYVRNVVVDGLQRTRPDVVTDRISLHAGDPLSQSEINGSQRRLYDLGIFSRVDAAIQNPDGDEPTKYVLYSIEEAGTLFDERRRGRGNRTHRRRHHLARFAGRRHRL